MGVAVGAAVTWAVGAFSSAVAATAGALTTITAGALSASAATAVASSGLKFALSMAASTALSAIMRPSTPSSGTALDFKPDPKAPVRGLMGYHATGGNKVFQATWGYNRVAVSLGVALSLGPIDSIQRFEADGSLVQFTGPQNEAIGFYDADMWQKTTFGLPTDSALLPPTGLKYGNPPLAGWGSANAAKGVSFAFWTMVLAKKPENRDIFVNGIPDPRWIGRWMKVYDWRKDSTYPGGSGPQREDDWRTWQWSECPYVHARHFLRGHYKLNDDGSIDRTKHIAGVGASADAIDTPAFTEAANIADANGWKISGEWSTSDDKAQVVASMLQAGSGQMIPRGAQISVSINAPRVSTYTITRNDVVGQATVKPMVRRRERKNTIVPRYRSEAHNWEYVAADDVTAQVYRDEDRGEPRSLEVQYTYVRDPKQAAQLAAYDLVNLREGLTVTIPAKVHLMHVHPGDCITVNVPEMALENQKVIVQRVSTDYASAVVTLECRSESDGKHAFAMGQAAAPPPSPSLSAVDPNYIPPPLPVDVIVTPKPPSGGTSQPVIIVDIPVDRGDIAATIVEFGLAAAGPWTSAGPADPATGKYTLSGLNPNQDYWISVRYVAKNGTISDRYITGPHKAPGFIADTINRFPDGSQPLWSYPTNADLPRPPLGGQTVAWVEDEEKLYEYRNGEWTKKIDGGDIDPGTLTNLAFASGIRAPGLGSALPALPNPYWPPGSLFTLTTNGKTYTNDSGAWVVRVDGGDIVANSIVAGKFAAGAVTTPALAAGAVTASKVLITPSSINPDLGYQDLDFWGWDGDMSNWYPEDGDQSSSGIFGRYFSLFGYTGTESRIRQSKYLPLNSVKSGSVVVSRCRIRNNSNRVIAAAIEFYDETIQFVGGSYCISQPNSGTQSLIGNEFTVPNNAVNCRFAIIADPGPSYSGVAIVSSVDATEMATSSLIVDGSIITNKLAANSVSSDKIIAGAVTANKINVTDLAAINANLGAITAGSLNINNRFVVDSSGNITMRSATFGSYLLQESTFIKIYDNNVLRVHIGDLSA